MKLTKPFKLIIIITSIYVVILIALLVSGSLQNNNTISLLFSLAGGLFVWLITQTWTDWLRQEEKKTLTDMQMVLNNHAEKVFPPHEKDTKTILEHTDKILKCVDQKVLNLIEKKRKHLGKEYYNNLYKDVSWASISGIALVNRIRSITQANDPIVESLKKNSDVRIEFLISHPDSDFVKQRDEVERYYRDDNSSCSEDIINNVKLLMKFALNNGKEYLKGRNTLAIRMTKIPQPMAITYVKSANLESLLMGLILYHDLGNNMPIYEVPIDKDDSSLFKNCKSYFNKVFEDSKHSILFSWNYKGPGIDPHGDLAKDDFFTRYDLEDLYARLHKSKTSKTN